jgi:hypothetical protein
MLRHSQFGLVKIIAARVTSTEAPCFLVETENGKQKLLLSESRYWLTEDYELAIAYQEFLSRSAKGEAALKQKAAALAKTTDDAADDTDAPTEALADTDPEITVHGTDDERETDEEDIGEPQPRRPIGRDRQPDFSDCDSEDTVGADSRDTCL